MGLQYYKRVGGNKGLGLNFSNSGVSSSCRTKYGSISSKGFSIRSGIPGLTFRSYGRKNDKGVTALIILGTIIAGFAIYYSIVILYNLILFLFWGLTEVVKLIMRIYYGWKEKN